MSYNTSLQNNNMDLQNILDTIDELPNVNSDGNLIAENIKKDVTIFGVTGTYEGGGGTGEDVSSETDEYTNKLTLLGTAITELETELQNKVAGSGGESDDSKYCNITMQIVGTAPESVTLSYISAYEEDDGTLYEDWMALPLSYAGSEPFTDTTLKYRNIIIYESYEDYGKSYCETDGLGIIQTGRGPLNMDNQDLGFITTFVVKGDGALTITYQ